MANRVERDPVGEIREGKLSLTERSELMSWIKDTVQNRLSSYVIFSDPFNTDTLRLPLRSTVKSEDFFRLVLLFEEVYYRVEDDLLNGRESSNTNFTKIRDLVSISI